MTSETAMIDSVESIRSLQLYQYLSVRSQSSRSPKLFLHRNLSYMRSNPQIRPKPRQAKQRKSLNELFLSPCVDLVFTSCDLASLSESVLVEVFLWKPKPDSANPSSYLKELLGSVHLPSNSSEKHSLRITHQDFLHESSSSVLFSFRAQLSPDPSMKNGKRKPSASPSSSPARQHRRLANGSRLELPDPSPRSPACKAESVFESLKLQRKGFFAPGKSGEEFSYSVQLSRNAGAAEGRSPSKSSKKSDVMTLSFEILRSQSSSARRGSVITKLTNAELKPKRECVSLDKLLSDVHKDRFPSVLYKLCLGSAQKQNAQASFSCASASSSEKTVQRSRSNEVLTRVFRPYDRERCPLCALKARGLYALLKHLRRCHARFNVVLEANNAEEAEQQEMVVSSSSSLSSLPPSHSSSSSSSSGTEEYMIVLYANEDFDGGKEIFLPAEARSKEREKEDSSRERRKRGRPPKKARTEENEEKREGVEKRKGVPRFRQGGLVFSQLRSRISLSWKLDEFYDLEGEEEELGSQAFAGFDRQYFHSRTLLPILPSEQNEDSDIEEGLEDWLPSYMCEQIDEFSDVNKGEKTVFKLWNLFIMKHPLLAKKEVFNANRLFVEEHSREILERKVSRNLLLHFVALEDYELLTPKEVRTLWGEFKQREREFLEKGKKV